MEFGRRMATERDLEKTDTLRLSNVGNEQRHFLFTKGFFFTQFVVYFESTPSQFKLKYSLS